MNCKEIRDSLSAYLEGLVSADEKQAMREHLDQCPKCRTALEDLKKTQTLLKSMDAIEPPPWLAAKIMAQVRDEAEKASQKGWKKFFLPLHIKMPIQAFATILIVVLAVQLYKTMEPQVDLRSGGMKAEAPIASEAARQDARGSAPILPDIKSPSATKAPVKAKAAEPKSLPVPDPGRDAMQASGSNPARETPKPSAEPPVMNESLRPGALKMETAPRPSEAAKAAPPPVPAAPQADYEASSSARLKAKADMEMAAERSYRAEKKAMSRDFTLKSMAAAIPAVPVAFSVRVPDAASAARDIEDFLNKMGAGKISCKAENGRPIITAETDREGAAALVKRLNEMGKTSPATSQWPSGRFSVKIEIFSD